MECPKEAGIYKLTCKINGKIYVGKSVDINRRIKDHKRGRDGYLFKRAIKKHGWDSFDLEILEIVKNFDKLKDNSSLLDREAYYIELFDSTNLEKGYNLCKHSNDTTGTHLSEEHKAKLRIANLGRKMSRESIEKTRQANLGRIVSNETREKLRQASLGKTKTPHSEETKRKIGLGNLGKIVSEETKEKMRKPKSEEHKEKMRQVNLGKKLSEETKEKMRQSHLKRRLIKTEI
jgi:group I intron endonuclease